MEKIEASILPSLQAAIDSNCGQKPLPFTILETETVRAKFSVFKQDASVVESTRNDNDTVSYLN